MEDMEFLKAMLAEMNAKMDTTQDKLEANWAKTDAKTKAMQYKRTKAIMNAWREETMSFQITTVACLDSKELNLEDMFHAMSLQKCNMR
jgi:hypothetical protein